MAQFRRVTAVTDLPPGTMKAFEIGHERLVVCHTTEGIYAVADECSHDSAPISEGRLHGDEIICPRHGARFSVKDGSVKAPPALVPIDTYEVRIEGNEILVRLE
ncbi:MAG TPA: non-heme iron oxygenase ferredoxin subunit [Candidatus Deferrimicrobium sp.]|nr:non-heme iron oxygenase ferredoxin subunit [Candidatus Deferrimicrobium sp.]